MKYAILCNILIFAFCISSCDQDVFHPIEAPPTTENAISAHNGILAFPTYKDFTRAYTAGVESDEENYLLSDATFTSMSDIEDQLDGLFEAENTTQAQLNQFLEAHSRTLYVEPDSSLSPIIPDPVLASMVNQDGLLVIEDTVFQFTPQYVRRTAINDMSELQDRIGLLDRLDNEAPGVWVFDQLEAGYPKNECSSSCTSYDGKKYRLKGKTWKINLYVVKSHGVKSKSQKKRWYGWGGKKARYIYVSGSYRGQLQREKARRNKRKARIILSFSFIAQADINDPEETPDLSYPTTGNHKMKRYSSARMRTCSTCRR